MTIWDAQPLAPVSWVPAGGFSTSADIVEASRDAALFVDNSNATDAATEEAYNRRNAAIFKATGKQLFNPMTRLRADFKDRGDVARALPNNIRDWNAEAMALQNANPDKARDIRAHVPIHEDAKLVALQAGQRLDEVLAAKDGLATPFAAQVYGGFKGSLHDPLQVALLFAGGGAGGARTIGGKILSTFLREALVNGAGEAALQPFVQKWRAEVGLPHGMDQALGNIGAAALMGGVFGGSMRALGEVAGKLFRGTVPESHPLRMAGDGDVPSLLERMAPAQEHLPPELRGAIDALQSDRVVQDYRRPSVSPDAYDAHLGSALQAAQEPEQMAAYLAQAQGPPQMPSEGIAGQVPAVPEKTAIVVPDANAGHGGGVRGPLFEPDSYGRDWGRLVAKMKDAQGGDAPAAIQHPQLGPIDVVWGQAPTDGSGGFGLAKIIAKHPEVVNDLPQIVAAMTVQSRSGNRVILTDATRKAVVRLDFDSAAKQWLMTAYEKGRRGRGTTERSSGFQVDTSSTSATGVDMAQAAAKVEPFEPSQHGEAQTQALEKALTGQDDMLIPVATVDGELKQMRLADVLEEARTGEAAAALIEGCNILS